MKKRITIPAMVALMLVTAAVTMVASVLLTMRIFDTMVGSLSERQAMYSRLNELDQIVRKNYYGELDVDSATDEMLRGYVYGTGDTYARYYTAAEYQEIMASYEGYVVGIGVTLQRDAATGYLKVIEVYESSPASEVGLQKDDMITAIDDLPLLNSTSEVSLAKLKGDAGTEVKLVIQRGTEEKEFSVVRRRILVPTVQSRNIGDYGYIKISEFTDQTPNQFIAAYEKVTSAGAKGLIIDLRFNGGGTVDACEKVLNRLVGGRQELFATVDASGKRSVRWSSETNETDLPIAVLINGSTVSAAEIMAGSLADLGKAKLVGSTTYGKGMMQTLYTLDDGSCLDITTAVIQLPKTGEYNGVGLKADYEVKMSAEMEANFSQLTDSTDPQILKAVEYLDSVGSKTGPLPTDNDADGSTDDITDEDTPLKAG